MTFAVIAMVLGLLVLAEVLGISEGMRRIARLRRRAPIDAETGLRSGSVLHAFLLTSWARADREGGVVHVDLAHVQCGDPRAVGMQLSALGSPMLHAFRLDPDQFAIVRWARPDDEEPAGLMEVLESGDVHVHRMSSSSCGAAEVALVAAGLVEQAPRGGQR